MDMQHPQQIQVPGGEAVVQRLRQTYFEGKVQALGLFKELIMNVIGLHRDSVKLRD